VRSFKAIRREREDLSGSVMSGTNDADQRSYLMSKFGPNDFPIRRRAIGMLSEGAGRPRMLRHLDLIIAAIAYVALLGTALWIVLGGPS
jgi:hypothetical protein